MLLYHYKKSLAAFKKNKDTLGLVYVYNNLGNFYKRKGDYDSALQYLKKADCFIDQDNDCSDNHDYGRSLLLPAVHLHELLSVRVKLQRA